MALARDSPLGSTIFALLIGISNYTQDGMGLQGARKDAEAFCDYLKYQLGVPEDRIVCLLDDSATRANIIAAFKDLAANPLIQRDDPILIYYAGHGTRVPSPKEWTVGPEQFLTTIEAIVPRDFSEKGYPEVDVIPDRTIDVLIRNIHNSKGDNILVVFDCCYAGSANRTDYTRPRGWTFDGYTVPQNLDSELVHTLRQKIKLDNGALSTHVFFAACRSDERAMERGDRGVFTSALLDVLARHNINELTYTNAMSLVEVRSYLQHPECSGIKSNRLFFKQTIPDGWEHCFEVTLESDGRYTLAAGTVNGVSIGAKFDLYRMHATSGGPDGSPLSRMAVIAVGPLTASLQPLKDVHSEQTLDVDLAGDLVAKQVTAGTTAGLNIYWGQQNHGGLPSLDFGGKEIQVTPVENEEDSFLSIQSDGEKNLALTIRLSDPEHVQWRLADRIPSTDVEQLRIVLTAAARFYHLLDLATEKKLNNFAKLEVAFNELSEKTTEIDVFEEPYMVKRNLYEKGKAEITVTDAGYQIPYGLSLLNKSQTAFWATVLFFGCSDFTIEHICHLHLPQKGELRVGYGGVSGADPFTFVIPDGQEMDVGYFKIILSTHQVDLAHLAQSSPFAPGDSTEQGTGELDIRAVQKPSKQLASDYGVTYVPVILRRALH